MTPDLTQESLGFSNIEHRFQNLKSWLRAPHKSYGPLIIGDEDHTFYGARKFFLSPFFNIGILGGAGRHAIFHEIVTELSQSFEALKKTACENPAMEELSAARKTFLKSFDTIGYHNINHIMGEAYEGFAETVVLGAQRGIEISPGDLREVGKSTQLEKAAAEITAQQKIPRSDFFGVRPFREIHKTVMGYDFPHDHDVFAHVIHRIVTAEKDEAVYLRDDAANGEYMAKTAAGKPLAAIMGNNHLQGDLLKSLETHTGASPVLLDISLWHSLNGMVSKIYAGQPAAPVYVVMADKFLFPAHYMPDAKKLAEFRSRVLEKAGVQPGAFANLKIAARNNETLKAGSASFNPAAG